MLTFKQIQQIETSNKSPFYLCDGRRFSDNFDQITKAFSSRWSKFILAYSYKTNYIPYLCQIIKDKGGWAEVVSRLEYDLALKIGQQPDQIIFNGPVKQYEDIEFALKNNSIVNLDSMYEIEHVLRYARQNPGKTIPIGIRVNIGLTDNNGQSHIQNQLQTGRFGFTPDEIISKFSILNSQLQTHNLKIVSLHGHTSSIGRNLWCYETITKTLCTIAQEYFPKTVNYINVGGGLFGQIPAEMGFGDVPGFDDYAAAICGVLQQNPWAAKQQPALVIEPGVAMSANVISLVTRVVGLKTINSKTLVTVDGSAFHVKPTLHARNLPWALIPKDGDKRPSIYFSVVGATCMEKDYLLTDVEGPRPQIGDFIQIGQAGAYTVVLSPPFINPAPAIVAVEGESFKVIRTRQTLDDMFRNYTF
jgi:diaminopimelate decarboxylase